MPYLVTYDIEADKLRNKTANKLLELGLLRMQKSVFIGNPDERILKLLNQWLIKNIPDPADSSDFVLILSCTKRQLRQAKRYGKAPSEWEEIVDPPNTLII